MAALFGWLNPTSSFAVCKKKKKKKSAFIASAVVYGPHGRTN